MFYSTFKINDIGFEAVGDNYGLQVLNLVYQDYNKSVINKSLKRNDRMFSEVVSQLTEYLNGQRKIFNLKLNPQGTIFQKTVWQELSNIRYGQTITYKQLAEKINKPKASRAVGAANGKNPIPLIIPCHRVIGSNGKLTGFAFGLPLKERLLNSEKVVSTYNKLLKYYGPQNWWPANSIYEMMIGAILTQNTSWSNVEKALSNFDNKLIPEYIDSLDINELAQLIKPSGYYNEKSKKIKELNIWYKKYNYTISNTFNVSKDILRTELLSVYGIGKETADCILTYALEKPSFVIDTYTKRLLTRLGFCNINKYDDVKKIFESAIYPNLRVYQEYHGLIVKHATTHCLKKPRCFGCPFENTCKKVGI